MDCCGSDAFGVLDPRAPPATTALLKDCLKPPGCEGIGLASAGQGHVETCETQPRASTKARHGSEATGLPLLPSHQPNAATGVSQDETNSRAAQSATEIIRHCCLKSRNVHVVCYTTQQLGNWQTGNVIAAFHLRIVRRALESAWVPTGG